MRTRWAHVSVRVFSDREELDEYKAVSFSYDENINVDRATYQGDVGPRLDASAEGGTGSIEFRLEHGFGDPTTVFERYLDGLKNLDDTGKIHIVATRVNPRTRQQEGRRFENCQVTQSERGGEGGPWTVTWNFEYETSEKT
jgi:hypothetical protein